MANKLYIVGGKVYEETREGLFIVGGKVLEETTVVVTGVTFDGPDVVNQTGVEQELFTFDENAEGTVASRFTGATTYALSPLSSALPAGITVDPTTGNLVGTPDAATAAAYPNVIIRGSE